MTNNSIETTAFNSIARIIAYSEDAWDDVIHMTRSAIYDFIGFWPNTSDVSEVEMAQQKLESLSSAAPSYVGHNAKVLHIISEVSGELSSLKLGAKETK